MMYPLQKCFNVCGVISILIMIISILSPPMFHVLTSPKSDDIPNLYITQPTKYNRYLRQVLMSWISNDNIEIKNVVPNRFIAGADVTSDIASDSDDHKDIPCVDCVDSTPEHVDNQAIKSLSKTDDGKFHCNKCTSAFGRKNDLKRHLRKKHEEQVVNSGNCHCLECGQIFFTIEKLREHLTYNHSNEH